MSTSIKKVVILGATGSVGKPILAALLAEPSFTVTIVTRASSSATFPADVPVKTVSDDFTIEELVPIFRGQDAVVVALSTLPVTAGGKDGLAFRLIDAALSAGVKRFIPSEFGANNLDPRARALVPTYDIKGTMLTYLQQVCASSNGAMTWTSISCGSWLDWALDPSRSGNFLGIDIKQRTALIYDSGNNPFAITTSSNTGLAVARALIHADITANKQVFLCDFQASTREIVAELEKQLGAKFSITKKDSAEAIKELKQRHEQGDGGATFGLLALSFGADVNVGYDFLGEQQVWNERLGLPKVRLEEVIKEVIEVVEKA